MKKIISARHFDLADDLRERADQTLDRVAARAHRPHRGEVIFDFTHGAYAVEIRFHTVNSQVFTCVAEDRDPRVALDDATHKALNHYDKEPRKKPRKDDRQTA